jgi:high-affinity iron transporter
MKAKEGDQSAVSKNMELFANEWQSSKKEDSKPAKKIDERLKEVQSLLAKGQPNKEAVTKSLSSLSTAVLEYDKEQNPQDKAFGKEKVKQLLPLINNLKAVLKKGDTQAYTANYQAIMNQWNTAAEKIVHDKSITSYGTIEKNMALIRIAITQDPPNPKKALELAADLTREVENVLAGKTSKQNQGNYSLSDVTSLLSKADNQILQDDYQKASVYLNNILTIWPMVEGDVQTRDSKLYSDIETKIPTAISILNSKKVDSKQASDIVQELNKRLAPLLSKTNYTLWDAALILLREGFEGLLIVVTLMAFLKKMGQSHQQKWIWTGVAVGIIASAILAIIINILFSEISAASSREYIEGWTGVFAVLMMLTVGAWLHNKSSIGNWNKYINQQMNQALAKGSLVSFSFISFLSVFREGAETIIFYTGITPYISLQQLVMGVILAIFILAVVGVIIIYYSVKIPIRLFFKVCTLFIYFLAFKILGISIHSLQISKMLSTTTVERLPFIEWLGLYPTRETTIIQLLLLVVIISMTFFIRKKDRVTINV